MADLDFEKLVSAMNSPAVAKNAGDLMGLMKEINAGLAEFQKTTNMLKSMGILPLLVRAAAKKMGVDADTPLKSDEAGIIPRTDAHKLLISLVNSMDENALIEFSKRLQNNAGKPDSGKPENK